MLEFIVFNSFQLLNAQQLSELNCEKDSGSMVSWRHKGNGLFLLFFFLFSLSNLIFILFYFWPLMQIKYYNN
jgi:hypothetical protein